MYSTLPNAKQSYYPFLMAFMGLLILTVINGLTTTSLSTFDEKIIAEFGWSRSEAKFREWTTSGTAFALIFFAGLLIDKIGVKKLMIFGAALLSVAFALYSKITNATEAYGVHVLLGIALITGGSVPTIILVSSWFKEKRGLALGITLAGTSMGGVIFPKLIVGWIERYGWRDSMEILAIFPLLLIVFIVLLVRGTPSKMGLLPYGDVGQTEQESDLTKQGIDYKTATQSLTFWLICICGFLSFFCLVGVVANTFLHFRGLAFEPQEAALALSIYFLLAGSGKFALSFLSDYIDIYKVFTACFILMTLGFVGFATLDKSLAFASIALTGLSWGGMYTLYNIVTVKTFGLKAAGKINGTISMFESIGAAFGPLMMGLFFDKTGSYQLGFVMMAVLMCMATILSFKLKKTITL